MDGFNPGLGGCELNDDGHCEICVMLREIYSYKPKQFRADGFRDSTHSALPTQLSAATQAAADRAPTRSPSLDGFNPGSGGGSCEGGCELNDGGDCEVCAPWKELSSLKQFIVVASGGFRDSLRIPQEVGSHLKNMIALSEPVTLESPDGRTYPVEVSREFGAVVLRSGWPEFVNANHIEEDYSILFVYHGNSIFKVDIVDSSGHEKSSSCSQPPSGMFGAVPPRSPCDDHVLNEQVVPNPGHLQTSTDFFYTTFPPCCVTEAQDRKVLEIARTMKSKIPLHVGNLDSYVYIPLKLVLNHFKDEITKSTIQLEAPDKNLYSVGASKHKDDQVVLGSGWDTFVVSHHIQEKDLLIFRSTEDSHLKVLILDPSGHEKTSSCFVMGNSSSTQEMCGNSVPIVDPPPRAVFDLGSSDDDDILRGGTRESCRAQKRVRRSCAKTQKIASAYPLCTKSGSGACKPHGGASVKVEPLSNNVSGPSQRPCTFSVETALPCQLRNKIAGKLQAIGSEVPLFVKVMTKSSVNGAGSKMCVMNFGVAYANAYLPGTRKTLLLKVEGKQTRWETTMHVRRDNLRCILRGWREFAVQNGLEVGDVCLFQLASEASTSTSLTMMVYVIRKP